MTNITIETINGKQCTVIRKPFDAAFVKEQLSMGIPVVVTLDDSGTRDTLTNHYPENLAPWVCGGIGHIENNIREVIVILPPLPRHPKPEDAPLLCRYMAEGIEPVLRSVSKEDGNTTEYDTLDTVFKCLNDSEDIKSKYDDQFVYALYNGEKVEIALYDR